MGKIILKGIAIVIAALAVPLLLTLLLSGTLFHLPSSESEEALELSSNMENSYSVNDYIMMAMAGTIDLSMNMETLKAQAVIIRTNIYEKLQEEGGQSLTIETLGLETKTLEELKESVSVEEYSTYISNMENAIYSTKGQIMSYQGKPILAYFHYANAGQTRSYEEVYGEEIAYLTSVESGADVEAMVGVTTKEYTCKEALSLLKEQYTIDDITEDNLIKSLQIKEKEESGYVHSISLGNLTIEAEEFRKLFGLNSVNFYFEEKEGMLRIVCRGKGSGLGFSQFGADAMANNGISYSELLTYYYPGAAVSTVEIEE